MKVDSQEFRDLMTKWSKDAFQEEMQSDYGAWLENEDAHGRLPVKKMILHVVCAWCNKPMGEKDGQGVEGISHAICAECHAKVRAGTWQPPPKEK